jgi:hypothetical protein
MGDTLVQLPVQRKGDILVVDPQEKSIMRDDEYQARSVFPGFVILLGMAGILVALASMDRPAESTRVWLPGHAASGAGQHQVPSPCHPAVSKCQRHDPV